MPEVSSPDHQNVAASRVGSERPTSRFTGAEEASLPDNPEDEERNGLEIASAALGRPEKIGEVPFYAGKKNRKLARKTHRNLLSEQATGRGLLQPWIFARTTSPCRGISLFRSTGRVYPTKTRNSCAKKEYSRFLGQVLVKA